VIATAEGRRLAARMRRERTDALGDALASLQPGERERLEQLLPALEQLAEVLKGSS
jgi:DNA-binding MarR family transcriptional regulator